jgi:acyl-CoA synthetase (AMP-forming)/AMP-acid ligase II/acyl carrier protein
MKKKHQQILISENIYTDFPADNFIDLLQLRAKNQPDDIAFVFLNDGENEEGNISFKQMHEKAKVIAATLQKTCKKGDRAVLLFPNGIEFIVTVFGCLYAGVIAVPAYPPRRNKQNNRFKSIVENSECAFIITNENIYANIRKNFADEDFFTKPEYLVFENLDDQIASQWSKPFIDPEDLATLQYTSGSTGKPKGVMVSHRNIIYNSEVIKQAYGHTEKLIGVNWLPNFHDMGLFGTLFQIIYNGCINYIIPPAAFIRKPFNWLNAISKYKATTAGGPNFAFDYCIEKISDEERDQLDLSSLQVLFSGAEPVKKETIINFEKAFKQSNFSTKQTYPCYGLSESVLMVTGGDYKNEPFYFSASANALEQNLIFPATENEVSRELVSSGFPWGETKVAIVNPETKTVCQAGNIGEIWISSPSVCKGYWRDTEETERIFRAHLSDTKEGPFLRTGDLGFIHRGNLFVTGRLKDLIIIRGKNHYPMDIEKTVENCHEALVSNANAAFSIDVLNQERLVIIQEIKRTYLKDLNVDEVCETIRQGVAEEYELQVYSIVLLRTGSIPKTSSGKIQRRMCKADYLLKKLTEVGSWKMQLLKTQKQSDKEFTETEIKEWLIIWLSHKLGISIDNIDLEKPIRAYGLDSMAAVELENDVNEYFGVSWPLSSFLVETNLSKLIKEGKALLEERKKSK